MGDHKKLNLFFLIGCIFLTGAAVWGVAHGIKQVMLIPASEVASENGASYTTALSPSHYWLFGSLADSPERPVRSQTELFEDDKPLGPAHTAHDSIRKTGSGQFSHWGATLYFSSSDNSDPRTNGRHYKAVVTATSPVWVLAVFVAGLLIACYLNRQMLSVPIKRLAVRQNAPATVASQKIRWRWGVLAALALALVSLYPQIDLWLTRGHNWQGSYTSLCYDEEVYAAYINGLTLGRPRRIEPLEIPAPDKPAYESLFSIQVVPAYLIVFFTRVSGLTAAQAFIVLTPLMAFLAALMLFYLLASLTRDEALAAVGALAVLIGGTLAARHSAANEFFGRNWYGNFLFLRRYEPSVVFPAFFGFMALTWQALTGQGRRAWWAAIAAGAVFVVLIFSYFYLWTSAAAWLACLALVWLLARRAEWRLLVKRLAPTVLFAIPAFVVYAVMIGHRDLVRDKTVAVFNFTHAPDFYRAPQLIAAAAILLLLWGVKKGRAAWREPLVLLASSLALLPFAVFNQQIITGRSLESVHYEMFTANYVSLLALILMLVILWPGWNLMLVVLWRERSLHFKGWLAALLACAVIGWGVFEMSSVTAVFKARNIARDSFVPVTKRLAALADAHGKGLNDREVAFSPDILVVSDNIAPFAPQTPFWASHMAAAGGLSRTELQERYFQYLYYSGSQPEALSLALKNNDLITVASLFGYERYNPTLVANHQPITSREIEDKVRQYSEYVASFDGARAQHPKISYVVVDTRSSSDLTTLDRWYRRDAGERIGPFTLYQMKLRDLLDD